MSERESMPVDVVIVGAGPAGLAAAIRLKQLDAALEVVVLEKGSEVGAHILSGAVIDPRALDELLPEWRETCPLAEVPVTREPPLGAHPQRQVGNAARAAAAADVERGQLHRLARQRRAAGSPSAPRRWGCRCSPASRRQRGAVRRERRGRWAWPTQDMGVAADGSHKADYQPGMELHAKYTLFAEGARGHLTKRMKQRGSTLEAESQPQVYGLGIKELWDVAPDNHEPGKVIHTQGWPLSEHDAWGGGFLYHQANGQVALGFVTALDYANPWISPFEEFQRWKQHPAIRAVLEGGRRVAYGARAINEGGWQ